MCTHVALLLLHTVLAHPTNKPNNSSTCPSPYSEVADYQAFPDQNAANSGTLFPMPLCHGHHIEEAAIDQIQSYLTQRTLTSQQLAFCYMQRMWQTDDYLNAVLEINPDLMQIAIARDQERITGRVRGPLHGIPFMVKDNIATKDKMQTTAGSWALQGSIVPRDAHVVHKLREAGAVLLGKATLSEWASMRSNNYSEGYSARGGQCRSAYNLTVNPGGSSSGSAVGVAANVFPFALGTETDGSVISPAERNAIVGIKPTVGWTSRAGVVPESLNQDTVGVFAKSVRDATYVLDAIYGPDERDNQTLSQVNRTPTNGYTQFLSDRETLQNATFGIPWQSFWRFATTEQQEVLTSMANMIEKAGARIVNNTEIMDYERIISPNGWNWDYGRLVILSMQHCLTGNRHHSRFSQRESEYTYIKVDFYRDLKKYLAELNNTNMRSSEDIVAYNYLNDGSEGGNPWPLGNPAFYSGQDGLLASLETKGIQDETYFQALDFCRTSTRERGIDHALSLGPNGTQLDALLVPPDVGQSYHIAAQAGYPVITIPAGVNAESGMPFGFALTQTAWREDALMKWASAIEDLMKDTPCKRTQPKWYGYLERNIPVLND
ncbi:hypothetical protein CBER1_00492 [Cercospora berteroae]|uniref:Amidase domain-containing protein n=1 Tax=Cercospora berteroae TaxID=357750 RepID=A0A2S6CB48_9PEZI|nr:hypothetical protein CBER1_00492 [Cercospora berteroae]